LIPWAKRVLYIVLPLLVTTQLVVSGKGLTIIQVVKSTLIALVYASVMILAIENTLGKSLYVLLSGRVLGSVGKYSYGMYVLHPFILSGLHKARLPYGVPGLFVCFLLTYIAAWISWTLFEKRFLGLKRFFEYDSDPRAPSVSPLSSLAAVQS
jgi:peptidoglycan/LPS O-acetylase OafA/YrhL